MKDSRLIKFGVCISEWTTAMGWRTVILSGQVVGLDDHCRFFPPEIFILVYSILLF